MPLTVKSRFVGNVYVIRCTGALVLGEETKALETLLEERTPEFSRYVLNMEGLTRLDSIGVGLLVRYTDRFSRRGGGIRLAAPPAFVTKVLELTMLTGLLPQYPTEDDAIKSFLKQSSAQAVQGKEPRSAGAGRCSIRRQTCASLCGRCWPDTASTCIRRACSTMRGSGWRWMGRSTSWWRPGGSGGDAGDGWQRSLQVLSPKARVLELDAEFEARDAGEATEALLRLFEVGP